MARVVVPALPAAAPVMLLGGCAAPEPGFFGLSPRAVVVEGEVIDVHVEGREVIAVRPGRLWPPVASVTARRGVAAAEAATRCRVAPGSVRAESQAMTARIDCG